MYKICINGRFLNSKNAKISVFDRGFMYGDGVFETMRSYAGVVFQLDGHLNRLIDSLKILKIKSPYTKACFKDAIYRILRLNKISNGYIKLTVTRGEGRFGISYKDKFRPNVVIVAKVFEGYPEWMFKRGVSASLTGVQNELSPLSGLKTLNYLPFILARFDAKDSGFDEAILVNTKGYITEGATSNLFIVKGKAITTPSLASGILPGVTRGVIISLAKKLNFKVREKLVTKRELFSADEIFLTNSLAEVIPVTKVDSKRIGSGSPGAATKLLHISYQKQVIREIIR